MKTNLKYFRKLKSTMFENDVDQAYIAKKIGKSKSYISTRLQGQYDFNLSDIYAIVEILKIPPAEVLDYFPKDGIA